MQEGIFELLRRYLETEEQSEDILRIPSDTYSKLARHMQDLRRISNSNNEDLTGRLIRKQTKIMQSMVNELLQLRLRKASPDRTKNLLPEERYVYRFHGDFKKTSTRFINAIINGYPSFFTIASKENMIRQVTVVFLKNIGEIVGFDLKRYGPFKIHDLAVIPNANAEALITNGDAALVQL